MIEAEQKYITFDCSGTLTAFGMSAVTRWTSRPGAGGAPLGRGDGAYKPYGQSSAQLHPTGRAARFSTLRDDLMPAHDLRVTNEVYVNRGYEPATPYYGYHQVKDWSGLLALLGL